MVSLKAFFYCIHSQPCVSYMNRTQKSLPNNLNFRYSSRVSCKQPLDTSQSILRLIKFFIRIIIIAMEASVGSNKTLGKGRGARFRHLYEASR